MSWYADVVLPRLIELACSQASIAAERAKVVPQARGRVLELGIGTGLNLRHYDRARVTEIVAVDPAQAMHDKARRRAEEAGIPLTLLPVCAEALSLPPESFDTVVCTYTLCSIADPAAALEEARRALKPGGALLFSEHGRAPDEGVQRWQDRLDRVWPAVAGGCHLNRDVAALLVSSGFALEELQREYLPGPRPWTYHSRGIARR